MSKIPIIDEKDIDRLIAESLKNGGILATPKESQMLVQMKGVSIGETPRKDGRYQGYIMLVDGDKQYVYGKTREDVAAKIGQIARGEVHKKKKTRKAKNEKPSPTLSEWFERWFNLYKIPNIKPTTAQSIRYGAQHALKILGDKKISKITTEDLQNTLLRVKEGRTRDVCKDAITQMFRKAKLSGIIKNDPCEGLEIKKSRRKKRQALTIEQQQRFIEAIRGSNIETLSLFLLGTGLRIGEALALTSGDIDFTDRLVTVSKNVVYVNGKRILQDTPKTAAGNRSVPIPDSVFKKLNQSETDIFPFTYSGVRSAFRRVSQRIGFEVSPHILRHTYATRLEEAGISPKLKQYLMGHASLEMTQNTYTDIQKEFVCQKISEVSGIFDIKKQKN